MAPRKILVIGAHGQLGRALHEAWGDPGHIEYVDRAELDITAPGLERARRWSDYATIVNAAAYTAVDLAETPAGRLDAWAANAVGVAALARVATAHRLTLVHISTDYVFDGALDRPYREDDSLAPLGVYAQSKAAGDLAVATVPRHFIVRTSWVIGDGTNFVRTMASLAERGVDPRVVDDQIGRLTFTSDLVRGIDHLLATRAAYGVYNLTSGGDPMSWADAARAVFALTGHDPARVVPVSTEEYFADASAPVSPRPRNSVLDLSKIEATGFVPGVSATELARYLAGASPAD